MNDHDYLRLPAMLNNIGALHFGNARYDIAIERYQESLKIRAKINQSDVANESVIVGRYQEALKELQKLQTDVRCTRTTNQESISMYKIRDRHFDSFCISKPILIDNDEEEGKHDSGKYSAITFYNIALIYHRRKFLNKAMEYFNVAFSNSQAAACLTTTAEILSGVGKIYYEWGHQQKAMEIFSDVIRLHTGDLEAFCEAEINALNFLSLTNPSRRCVLYCLSNIGYVYFKQGKYDKALEICYKTLQLRKLELGDDHIDVAISTYNIGLILYHKRNLREAFKHCEAFLQRARGELNNVHADIANAWHTAGLILFELGYIDKAVSYMCESLQITKNMFGKGHVEVAIILHDLGRLLFNAKQPKRALYFYEEALELKKMMFGYHHEEVAIALCGIGQIYHKTGELDQALKVYNEALTIVRHLDGEVDDFSVCIIGIIGHIHFEREEVGDAAASFGEIAKILPTTHDAKVQKTLRDMIHCYSLAPVA